MYSIFKKFLQAIAISGFLLLLIFSGIVMFTGKGHSEELEPGHDTLPSWLDQDDWAQKRVWEVFQNKRGLYFINKKTFERLWYSVSDEYIKNEETHDPNFSKMEQLLLMLKLAEKVLDRELNQPIGPSFQCQPHMYSDGATHLDCW